MLNPHIEIAGIDLEIVETMPYTILRNEKFASLCAVGHTLQEAINDFLKLLPDLITEYALYPDEKLSGDGKELKHHLLKCFGAYL